MASSSSSAAEHAADEAGGEAIFSSDGLAPLPAVVAPPPVFVAAAAITAANGETILDTGDVRHPLEAFEVFRGKVYPPSRPVKTVVATNETPLQRLARLQQETEEWIRDFDASQYGSTSSSCGDNDDAGDGKTVTDDDALQVATALRGRLREASLQIPLKQHKLTQVMQTKLQEIGTTTTVPTEESTVTPSRASSASASTTALEQRLLRLEQQLLGGSNAHDDMPLLQRLEVLERGFNRVDAKTLEDAATKAKVIRADLEAASKAKTKLALPNRKEDSKTIVSLHDQMVELQGLSSHLPALVHRLQQLATIHGQAANFASRLGETEQDVVHIGSVCTKLEDTLARVETGMMENLTKMETNMKLLDERLSKLS